MINSAHILVVDDNPILLEVTTSILEIEGYEISKAVNGTEALQFVAKEPPDIIILDVMLPDINGKEVCQKIKEDPKLSGVMVIMLSGVKTESAHHAEGLDYGADDYMSRPVSNRELLARVRAALRIKQAEDKIRDSQKQYQSIFQDSPIGIELFDKNGVLLEINQACLDIFGMSDPTEVQAFKLFESPYMTTEKIQELQSGIPVRIEVEFDFEANNFFGNYQTTKTGKSQLDVRVTPMIESGSKIQGYLVHIQDISEQKSTQEELQQTKAILEQRVEDRTQELAVRIEQVEKLNQAMSNLLIDLRYHQVSLEKAGDELQIAHEQLQKERVQEQAALLNLSQGLLGMNDQISVMNYSVQLAMEALNADFSAIAIVDEERKFFKPSAWAGWPTKLQISKSNALDSNLAMAKVIQNQKEMVISDIRQEKELIFPAISKDLNILSALLVPLISGEHAIGGMVIHGHEPREWTEDEIRLLSLIGNTTAQAMERARLFELEQTARNQAETIAQVSRTISASLEIKTILASVMKNVASVIPHDTGAIFVSYPDGSWEMVVARGYEESFEIENAKEVTVKSPIMQQMVNDLNPVLIPDVHKYEDWTWVPGAEKIRSFMGIPLIARNRLVGALMTDSNEPNFYTHKDLETTQSLVQHVAQAIDNALLYRQVEQGRRRLSRLSQRLVEVQEQERRRIARELHDEVGQLLTALTISLESISQLTRKSTIHERILEFQNLTQELITQINNLSTELRPRVLDDLGLIPGLVTLIKRISGQTKITVDFKHSKIKRKRIQPEVEINAYRVVQEGLTNVIRHAGVSQASVRLWMEPKILWVQIQDEGAAIPGIGAVELRWSRRKGQIAEISVFELNASSKNQANLW